MKHFVRRCCRGQDTFPAPSGSKAVALMQNRRSTKHSTQVTPANKGSHGRLKGTGMGRDTAVGHPPSPHLMTLGFPDLWMVSLHFKMRYDHVSHLCKPVTLLVFTTSQQAVPQFNYVIQNNAFCFHPALWCYTGCSPGLTLLLFHLLLPLALSRLLAHLSSVIHNTRARRTLPSLLSHFCYSGHLIPFTIFIFLVVTSLLLPYLFKIEEESKVVKQAALSVQDAAAQWTYTKHILFPMHIPKAMNGRRFH